MGLEPVIYDYEADSVSIKYIIHYFVAKSKITVICTRSSKNGYHFPQNGSTFLILCVYHRVVRYVRQKSRLFHITSVFADLASNAFCYYSFIAHHKFLVRSAH